MIVVNVPSATIDWLLEPANACVRAMTLRDVLGRREDDPELVAAGDAIVSSAWVRRLMRDQHEDGWWVNPKNCYQPRGTATVWHLQVLAELGVPGTDPRIARACDRFLEQNGMPDGGFACGVHRTRYSEECLTGHMLYTLVAFGRGKNARSRAARDWLLERQLPDGGWNCRPNQSHSSFISTLGAVKALAIMPGRTHRVALKRSIEFLLAHRLFFSCTTGKPVKGFWPPSIQFPAHYSHDLLQPLRTVAIAGAKPGPRLDDALDLLEARADPRSRWRIDVVPTMRIEAPARPSKWATASALGVLRTFGRLTLG
jgi:hypothetical protein